MRPYNFHLSPMVEKRLKVEREFSYQSGGENVLSLANSTYTDILQPWNFY